MLAGSKEGEETVLLGVQDSAGVKPVGVVGSGGRGG